VAEDSLQDRGKFWVKKHLPTPAKSPLYYTSLPGPLDGGFFGNKKGPGRARTFLSGWTF
jgi:hypothetical protein